MDKALHWRRYANKAKESKLYSVAMQMICLAQCKAYWSWTGSKPCRERLEPTAGREPMLLDPASRRVALSASLLSNMDKTVLMLSDCV